MAFFFGKFNIRFLAFEQGIPTKFIEVIVNSMKYFIYNVAIYANIVNFIALLFN